MRNIPANRKPTSFGDLLLAGRIQQVPPLLVFAGVGDLRPFDSIAGSPPTIISTMSGAHTAKPIGPLSPQYINFVYIPSAILIAGTAAFKLQWVPLALAVAAALGGFQFYTNRMILL